MAVRTYKAEHNDAGKEQLDDDQEAIDNTELADVTVHAREHVGRSLTDSNHDTDHYNNNNDNNDATVSVNQSIIVNQSTRVKQQA